MSLAFRISIGANVVLAGIVAALAWSDRPAKLSSRTSSSSSLTQARTESSLKPGAISGALKPKYSERGLDSSTVAQLERSGISRDILMSVLLEDLNRRSARRLLELQKKYAPRLVPEHEMHELTRASVTDQIRELKAVFGEDGYLAWDREQTLHNLNRARVPGDELPMSLSESEQAVRWQKEFDEKNTELQMAMEDGVADKADIGVLQAQAQQTLDQALEKLLGKQRFGELRGNIDPVAEVYRNYGGLNPTPAQAKAVAAAEDDYRANETALTNRLNGNPANVANIPGELGALNEAREEKLRGIFGAEAYNNLKRQNDPTYQTLRQYAGTWELGDQDIQSVYEALQSLGNQTNQTRQAAEISEAAGQRVNWREVNAAIDLARQQTEVNLQSKIGSERLRRLKQNGVLTNR